MRTGTTGRHRARGAMCAVLLLLGALAGPSPSAAASPAGGDRGQLFASIRTERTARFLAEEFDFTLAVYSRGLTMGREISLVNEETPGLRFYPFRDRGSTREEVDGTVYDVRRFLGRARAVAIGAFALHPAVRLSVVVPGRTRGGTGDPLTSGAEIRDTEIHPAPLTVTVQALPAAGRPDGFTGAVGAFTLAADLRPSAVAAGEPVTLSLEIRGSGSLASVTAPAVPAGERFKVYDPKLLRREIGEDGSGRLVFEQVLVPRSPAANAVPAVAFSYFDPERRAYRELVRGPFPLSVRPGSQAPVPAATPVAAPQAAKPRVPAAIAPLKAEPKEWLGLPVNHRHASPWFLALQGLPLAVAVALYLAARRRAEAARNPEKTRRQLAPRAAAPGFDAAAKALADGDAAGFHDALWEALAAFFLHRLNLRPGEMNGPAVSEGLARAGHDPGEVARLGEIFALLERERFGRPAGAVRQLDAAGRRRLETLLAEVDRIVRSCVGDAS